MTLGISLVRWQYTDCLLEVFFILQIRLNAFSLSSIPRCFVSIAATKWLEQKHSFLICRVKNFYNVTKSADSSNIGSSIYLKVSFCLLGWFNIMFF